MKIDITQAVFHPGTVQAFSGIIELPPQDIRGEIITFDPVEITGSLLTVEDSVEMHGEVRTAVHGACARCGKPVAQSMEIPFDEIFRRMGDSEDDEDTEAFPYEGKTIVPDDMVLTLLLLNLPMRMVCGEECSAGMRLTEWDEENTVWAEEDPENEPTYRPFEHLKEMMDEKDGDLK